MAKKIVSLLMIFIIVMMPGAFAFSFMGVDFGALWDKVAFWNNGDEKVKETADNHKSVSPPVSKSATSKEVKITLAGTDYTQSLLKSSLNSNEELKGYVKGFGYECVYVETDKGEKFTLEFNIDNGTLKSLKKGNYCEREIYLEESLITDISEDGFSAKNIKKYLDKIDLPWGMYAKALKVFAVG